MNRGSSWGPAPLPSLLAVQLQDRDVESPNAAFCADRIATASGDEEVAECFVDLGACNFLNGDVDGAMAAWRQAITSGVAAPASRALLNMGLTYEHLHLHDRAISVLGSLAQHEVDPWVTHGSMALARCQSALGETDEAMETMAHLAEGAMQRKVDPGTLGEALIGLGHVARSAGRLDRAERAWRVATSGPDETTSGQALGLLVELLHELGQDDDALELVDAAPGTDPELFASLALDRAEELGRLGRDDRAATVVQRLVGRDLPDGQRLRLAAILVASSEVNPAIDELEALLNAPDVDTRQRAAFLLGDLYESHDMAEVATAMFQRVVDGDDDYWSPRAQQRLDGIESPTQTGASSDDPPAPSIEAVDAASIAPDEPTASEPQNAEIEPPAWAMAHLAAGPAEDEPAAAPSDEVEPTEPADSDVVEPAIEAPDASPAQVVQITQVAEVAEVAEPIVVSLASVRDESEGSREQSLLSAALAAAPDEPDEPADPVTEHAPPAATAAPATTSNPYAALAPEGVEPPQTFSNPYAALAPDEGVSDLDIDFIDLGDPDAPPPSDIGSARRNPYAELAPNYATGEHPKTEGGAWQSLIDDWPEATDQPEPDSPGSRAFSRYT